MDKNQANNKHFWHNARTIQQKRRRRRHLNMNGIFNFGGTASQKMQLLLPSLTELSARSLPSTFQKLSSQKSAGRRKYEQLNEKKEGTAKRMKQERKN